MAREATIGLFQAAAQSIRGFFEQQVSSGFSAADADFLSVPTIVSGTSPAQLRVAAEAVHAADPAAFFHVIEVHTWTLSSCCGLGHLYDGSALKRAADKFVRRLKKEAPGTAFSVVAVSENIDCDGSAFLLFPGMRIGKL
jgi:hypothetical protein